MSVILSQECKLRNFGCNYLSNFESNGKSLVCYVLGSEVVIHKLTTGSSSPSSQPFYGRISVSGKDVRSIAWSPRQAHSCWLAVATDLNVDIWQVDSPMPSLQFSVPVENKSMGEISRICWGQCAVPTIVIHSVGSKQVHRCVLSKRKKAPLCWERVLLFSSSGSAVAVKQLHVNQECGESVLVNMRDEVSCVPNITDRLVPVAVVDSNVSSAPDASSKTSAGASVRWYATGLSGKELSSGRHTIQSIGQVDNVLFVALKAKSAGISSSPLLASSTLGSTLLMPAKQSVSFTSASTASSFHRVLPGSSQSLANTLSVSTIGVHDGIDLLEATPDDEVCNNKSEDVVTISSGSTKSVKSSAFDSLFSIGENTAHTTGIDPLSKVTNSVSSVAGCTQTPAETTASAVDTQPRLTLFDISPLLYVDDEMNDQQIQDRSSSSSSSSLRRLCSDVLPSLPAATAADLMTFSPDMICTCSHPTSASATDPTHSAVTLVAVGSWTCQCQCKGISFYREGKGLMALATKKLATSSLASASTTSMASAQYISFEMSADVIGTGSIVTAQRMPVGIPLTPMPLCATSVHRHTPKGSATKPDSSTTDKHISEWMHQLQKTVEIGFDNINNAINVQTDMLQDVSDRLLVLEKKVATATVETCAPKPSQKI